MTTPSQTGANILLRAIFWMLGQSEDMSCPVMYSTRARDLDHFHTQCQPG